MELKEIAIIFINAAAMSLGYSVVIYGVYNLLARCKVSFLKLFALMYFTAIIMSIMAIAYVPIGLAVISLIYLYVLQRERLYVLLSCLLSTVIFLLIMAANNIALAFIVKIPAEEALELRRTLSYNIYNSIIFVVLSLIAYAIINIISKHSTHMKTEITEDEVFYNRKVLMFVIITIVIFAVIISTAWFIGLVYPENARQYMTFSGIISLLIILFAIYAVYSIINAVSHKEYEIKIEKDKEITEIYKNEIQNMYENMRDFKHDYMKIYTSMSVLIEQNKIDELKKYFYNEIIPFQKSIFEDTKNSYGLTHLEDYIVQGVVYNYIIKAKNSNINFVVSLSEDIPKLTCVTSLELSRVLGILLDNAFEEVSGNTDKEKREVIFSAYIKNKNVIYVVKNTYGNKPDMAKMLSRTYSTKGSERGRGLAIAKQIIDEHKEALINLEIQQGRFIAKVLFDINEKTNDKIIYH